MLTCLLICSLTLPRLWGVPAERWPVFDQGSFTGSAFMSGALSMAEGLADVLHLDAQKLGHFQLSNHTPCRAAMSLGRCAVALSKVSSARQATVPSSCAWKGCSRAFACDDHEACQNACLSRWQFWSGCAMVYSSLPPRWFQSKLL